MAMDFTSAYASIIKYDKNDDGTLMVYGKATDDTLDLDQQICDPTWLDTAMPAWFKSGGNIREMHTSSAAGVAKEYESKADGHYINTLVVDPLAVKKVESGVYKGFSIGIKSPRVVRDSKAVNGRIIDGQIIEVSLVDRPANPSAKLIMAKSVEGESSLVQVEEQHEYKAPLPSEVAKIIKTEKGSKMETIKQITELAKSLTPDSVKFDKDKFDAALKAIADLIVVEAAEIVPGNSERESIENLLDALKHLERWYEGEVAEGEVEGANAPQTLGEVVADIIDGKSDEPELTKSDSCDCPDCADKCNKDCKCFKAVEPEAEKSADAEEVVVETTPEVSEAPAASDDEVKDLVTEAVKSAMESVQAEIDSLKADKEAAVEKSLKLESELAAALTKTVAGGPKRAATQLSTETQNDYLVKAIQLTAKADASTDPLLAEGYRELAKDAFKMASGTLNEKE